MQSEIWCQGPWRREHWIWGYSALQGIFRWEAYLLKIVDTAGMNVERDSFEKRPGGAMF